MVFLFVYFSKFCVRFSLKKHILCVWFFLFCVFLFSIVLEIVSVVFAVVAFVCMVVLIDCMVFRYVLCMVLNSVYGLFSNCVYSLCVYVSLYCVYGFLYFVFVFLMCFALFLVFSIWFFHCLYGVVVFTNFVYGFPNLYVCKCMVFNCLCGFWLNPKCTVFIIVCMSLFFQVRGCVCHLCTCLCLLIYVFLFMVFQHFCTFLFS